MLVTLSIDDDVLLAATAMAEREQRTLGKVISSLAREALQPKRNGVTLLRASTESRPVTMKLVNRLRDELL